MGKLFPTKNDLSESVRTEMIALLNARLADAVDLFTQVKQAHWNVKGPHFIGLHELFDDVAEGVEEYTDLIAERAIQLGGVALGTSRVAAASSCLNEYPLDISSGADHVAALATALSTFGKGVRAGIEAASTAGDADTSDLFTEVSRGIDKHLWMVEAHLQADA